MSLGQYKFCEMNYKNTSSSEDYAFGNCTQKTAVLIVTFPNRSGGRVCLQCRLRGRLGFDPWVGMVLWGRKWQTTPVFLPGESHGQRSLVDSSPWGRKESATNEYTSTSHMVSGQKMLAAIINTTIIFIIILENSSYSEIYIVINYPNLFQNMYLHSNKYLWWSFASHRHVTLG